MSQTQQQITPPNICIGSGVSFPASSLLVLCYCGRKFKKRFDNLKETWTIPKHEKKINETTNYIGKVTDT